ncbi:hypothetical protein Desmer_4535 [Desulfosporosinus meridiei DSM 13257]|uniref:Uncharacterized protein n=1 Tax=Desulfosporosinus meridiei (strain ATCC BAA-275 / DSM 13257 / KCTC 12902 / NCIMB 13706 / S10) TaxID=768704 RepID=J7J1Y4_DESMD|nr:hypothetical protein Desmer_4535 [Desulfosporosinus meridiei DSM 13257]
MPGFWEERFLHTSARYAADELDGSRAHQTSGRDECEPVARYEGANRQRSSVPRLH